MSAIHTLEVPGYQVVEFLGSGACSTIWKIREARTGQAYALKRVVKRHSDDERFLRQALNEHEIASALDHPVLRHAHELRRVKRWLILREIHLVMEFCEGRTVQDHRPSAVEEVVRIFGEVADGLSYMNAQGFVHADTKPNNILVAPSGHVKVIDFGQSCRLGTIKERIQGTPDFIAPEQVHRRPLDARTDVFNFGAALYWTLAGKAIPTAMPKTPSALVTDQAVTPLEKLNPQVPSPLGKLVLDCIEPHPSRRPSSMNEVASRLDLIAHRIARDAGKNGANDKRT